MDSCQIPGSGIHTANLVSGQRTAHQTVHITFCPAALFEKQNFQGTLGLLLQIGGMLISHKQKCSKCPIISDIIAATVYAPAVRKENENVFLLHYALRMNMLLEITNPSASRYISLSPSLPFFSSFLSPILHFTPLHIHSFFLLFLYIFFSFQKRLKIEDIVFTNILLFLVVKERPVSLGEENRYWPSVCIIIHRHLDTDI